MFDQFNSEELKKALVQEYNLQLECRAAAKMLLYMFGLVSDCRLKPTIQIHKKADKLIVCMCYPAGEEVLETSEKELQEVDGCRKLLAEFLRLHEQAHANPINKHTVCDFN